MTHTAKDSARSSHHTERTSRCMDTGWCYFRVLPEPTDKVLCTTDLGTGHQYEMEGATSRSVWRFVVIDSFLCRDWRGCCCSRVFFWEANRSRTTLVILGILLFHCFHMIQQQIGLINTFTFIESNTARPRGTDLPYYKSDINDRKHVASIDAQII